MKIIESLLVYMDLQMNTPRLFGWFHWFWLVLTAATTVLVWKIGPKLNKKQVNHIVLTTALVVIAFEVVKQVNFTFHVSESGITADYQWYAFPFQFCSTPMYVGLLVGLLRKGKLYEHLSAYLATYAIFAGLAVMLYPADVFTATVSINVQTIICHGSMIPIGALLYASGVVKPQQATLRKAMCVFSFAVVLAAGLNELAHAVGITETETFNMFLFSPYCDPSLPIYSQVQEIVPYPISLIVYILGFSAAAEIILLLAMACSRSRTESRKICPHNLTSSPSFAIIS